MHRQVSCIELQIGQVANVMQQILLTLKGFVQLRIVIR